MKKSRVRILVVKRSCINSKVVWLYYGGSKRSADKAYCLACKQELERAKKWGETAVQRRRNIMAILNECLADMSITDSLTPEQTAAAKRLHQLASEPIGTHRDFYEHVLEERRRREEDKKVRQQMREREQKKNKG